MHNDLRNILFYDHVLSDFCTYVVNKQTYPIKRMPYFYLHHPVRPHLLKMSNRCFRMHIHICSGKKLVLTLKQILYNR